MRGRDISRGIMHLKWLRATENANLLLLAVLKHRDGMKTASKTASGKARLREGLLVPVTDFDAKR
jgi:hypothetical protein